MAIICRDANAFRRNVFPILRDQIGMDGSYKAGMSVFELWGRKIHIIGCSDARSEGKLRGCTLQGALVDEASLIPESFMDRTSTAYRHEQWPHLRDNESRFKYALAKTGYIDNNPDSTTFYLVYLITKT